LAAAFILGKAPICFAITATVAIGVIVLGDRWIRLLGVLLAFGSVVFLTLEIQAARSLKKIMQEMQQISQAREAETAGLRRRLLNISTADGISKSEAELIAECYFHEHVACGAFLGIQDGGDFWVVDCVSGYFGKPARGFHIDKLTGKIASPIGPSYATPIQIFPKEHPKDQ
jgi:hypothetical protein